MRRLFVLLFAVTAGGCRPDLNETASLVTRARILAGRGDPPESKPKEAFEYRVLVASAAGTVEAPLAYWSLCTLGKPLDETGGVNQLCWEDAYQPVGGPAASLVIATPANACQVFGPELGPG